MFSVWEVAYYVRVSKRGYAKVGGSSWGNEGHGLLGRNSSVNKLKVQWRIIDFYAVHLRRFSTFFVKCEQEYSVHIWKVDISKFFLRSARSQIFFRAWLGNDESEFGLRAIFTQKSKLRMQSFEFCWCTTKEKCTVSSRNCFWYSAFSGISVF